MQTTLRLGLLSFALSIIMVTSHAAKPKIKTLKLTGRVFYAGYCIKKVPSGEGRLFVISPSATSLEKGNHDELRGQFNDNVVDDAVLFFASGSQYRGRVKFVINNNVNYILYGGHITGGEEPDTHSYEIKDSLIVTRNMNAEFTCTPYKFDDILITDMSEELKTGTNLFGYPFNALASFADNAKHLQTKQDVELNILRDKCTLTGDIKLDFLNGYKGIYRHDQQRRGFELIISKPNSDTLYYFTPLKHYVKPQKADKQSTKVVATESTSTTDEYGGKYHITPVTDKIPDYDNYYAMARVLDGEEENFVKHRFGEGTAYYIYKKNYQESVELSLEGDTGIPYNPENAVEKAMGRALYERYHKYTHSSSLRDSKEGKSHTNSPIMIKYDNGDTYVGSIYNANTDPVCAILSLTTIPDSLYYYGVLTRADGTKALWDKGYTLEYLEEQYRLEQEAEQARWKAKQAQQEKEHRQYLEKKLKERKPLYAKYGKKYVDALFDKGKILVGTPEGLVKHHTQSSILSETRYERRYKLAGWLSSWAATITVNKKTGRVSAVSYW